MKLDDWGYIYFRKLPYNFEGQVVLTFVDGKLADIAKQDRVDKERFLNRFKEARIELGDPAHGHRSDDVSAVTAK